MWIEGKYMTETEVVAYIASLKAECKAYKDELIDTLRRISMCSRQYENPDICCSECDYFYLGSEDRSYGCPTAYSSYAAKLRLEELTGVSRSND